MNGPNLQFYWNDRSYNFEFCGFMTNKLNCV